MHYHFPNVPPNVTQPISHTNSHWNLASAIRRENFSIPHYCTYIRLKLQEQTLIWIILLTALVFIVICLAKIVTFNTETASKCGGAPSFMESSVLCCSWICTNWMCMGYLVHSKYIQCPSHENIVAKLHRHHKDKASWGAVNVWMSSPPFSSNKILFPTFTIRLQFSIECASLNGSQVSKCYPNFIMCHWIFEHYHEFQLYSIMC